MYLFQPTGALSRDGRARCVPTTRRVYVLSLPPTDVALAPQRLIRRAPAPLPRASAASRLFGEAIIRLCNRGRRLDPVIPPADFWD